MKIYFGQATRVQGFGKCRTWIGTGVLLNAVSLNV